MLSLLKSVFNSKTSKKRLHYVFSKKADDVAFFTVSSCKIEKLLFEGTIYSPNYDLVIYFTCSNLLEKELLCTIKIDISVQKNEKYYTYHYKQSANFSPEKYFTRISGLFEDIEESEITVDIYIDIKSAPVFKDKKDTKNSGDDDSVYKKAPVCKDIKISKEFNIIPLELIEGENVYCKYLIYNASQMEEIFSDYNPNSYNYYISFNGTDEIIGPVNAKDLKKSAISQYRTHVFPISNKIHLNANKLAFFVEINNKKKEFFGIFPLHDIQKVFTKEYENLSVNNQEFDSKIDYPSGVIVFGRHKNGK